VAAFREADHRLLCGGSGCQELLTGLMITFLKAITCSAWVHLFAYVFWEEEPWAARGCPRSNYATAIVDPNARESALLWPIAPIERPHDVIKFDRRSRVCWICSHVRQIHTSTKAASQRKLRLSISVDAGGKHLYKPCYLDNLIGTPIHSCCLGSTCITRIEDRVASQAIGLA
jgi:hypothetical protein